MLQIDDIHVRTPQSEILAGFSLSLEPGRIVGLTGRSGAGKTTLIRAIMGFLNRDCTLSAGKIILDGADLARLPSAKRRALCGTSVGYIPQSPMTAFDPRLAIGVQMKETLHARMWVSKKEWTLLALQALALVNLPDGERVLRSTPAQLSGGMLQRVAMAILLAMKPRYILADEPTSALDIENRDLLLGLLRNQCADAGILFISHDVDALGTLCRTVMVLDEGRVVEQGPIAKLLSEPVHPWTKEFAKSYGNCETTGKEDWEWRALQ